MYKDKDKQREANRQASQRRRDKSMTQGMTNQGMTRVCSETAVIPCSNKRGKDIKCITIGDQAKSIETMAMLHSDACKAKRGKDIKLAFNNGEQSRRLDGDEMRRGKDIKYQMTVMERLFYRPASKLKPGETNFVSLPGQACYGVC